MSGTAEGSDKKIGQYPLIKQLGKGGMGSVWYSEHPYLRIPCAIKIMDAKLAKANPEFIQRFIQEGRLAAAISHPNVLKVYDANHEDDLFYMVLEYIDGCDIKKLAEDRGGKLPPEEVIEIAHAIGDALRDAYDNHQIIHRDIKPENILINQQGELKLADLGIGKQISEEQEFNLTMTGVAIGTAYYISPEQAMDSKHIDNRSDIYSFGATLYKLLTGDYPFTARTVTAMMMKHANEPLENPKLKDPSLPDNLCAVICKMMQKKPEDRYSSYSEFLDDINAIREANAPVESLTCAMEGIGSIEKENTPEPPVKKKMHVSKKAAKQVEKPKQKAQTKAPNKNHKTLLVCTIAAALLLIPLALMFNNKKTVQPQVENKAALVQQTNAKAPEQKKKTEKAPKAAVLDAFSTKAPTVEAVSTKPAEVKQISTDSDIVADLEKRLSKANGSHIEIKEYKIEGGEITALDLSDNQTLKDISELRDLPLSYLNLNHCSNLESLNGIQGTNLHELTLISSRPLKVSNLDPVKDLPLKILKVYNMPLLNNLEPLKTTELKTLYLVDCPNIKSLKPLSENVDLKYLEISSKQPSELRSLNGLEKLPLKTLIIENCPQVLSLRPVVNSSLEEIIIRKCSIPESELELLFQLPLQRIDTGNKNFDNRYWAFIENGRQALHNPENTLDEARDIFAVKPNKGPMNRVQNSFGDIQVNSLLSGELYIDGKKYANVTAKQTLNIPKLKTGDIHFELKTGKGSVEGIWEVEAGPMNKGLIPNSKLAYSANGLSSILVSKYMPHRIRKPSKPTSPFNREIYQVTQKSLKWFLENRNEHGVWGDEDSEVLTALVTLCFLTDRQNLYNENSHVVDKAVLTIAEAVRKYDPRQLEEYPMLALALTEAYALTKSKMIERDAAIGIERLLKCQGENGSFDPHDPHADRHSLIFSPWVFEALKTAYLAGIYQSEIKKAFNSASKLIVSNSTKGPKRIGPYFRFSPFFMDDGDNGEPFDERNRRPGEEPERRPGPGEGPGKRPPRGEGPGRPGEGPEFHGEGDEFLAGHMRAAGCFSLVISGTRTSKLTPALQYIARKDIDKIDYTDFEEPMPLMTWYLNSHSLYNYGGSSWNKWHETLTKEILKNYRNGYFEPVTEEEYGIFHGNNEEAKIFATSLVLLILNTHKRYLAHRSLP